MHLIRITGVPPYDGEYPLDLTSFNGRELREIKKISDVRANELKDALLAGDYDLVIAFAVIALGRAGRTVPPEALLEAQIGTIVLDDAPDAGEELDARPPDSSLTQSGSTSSGVGGENENEKKSSSGSSGSSDGESHQATPLLTGGPGSVPSAVSGPAISPI